MAAKWSSRSAVVCVALVTLCIAHASEFKLSDERIMKMVLQRVQRQAESDEATTKPADAVSLTSPSVSGSAVPRPANKTIPKVDWEEIDRLWHASVSDEEAKKKWDAMERGMKSGIRSALRALFPKVVGMQSEAKISGNCSAGMLKWVIAMRHIKKWAIEMLDAMGKPGSGVLRGGMTFFGNYRQCLEVRAPDDDDDDDEEDAAKPPVFKEFFRGKYCMLEIKPWLPPKPKWYGFGTKIESIQHDPADQSVYHSISELAIFLNMLGPRMDMCVPSLCSRKDMQRIATYLGKALDMRARVTRCEVMHDSIVLEKSQVTSLIILSIIIIIIVVITAWSVVAGVLNIRQSSSSPSMLKSLSLTNSWKDLANTRSYEQEPKLAALYGIRLIVTLWIITTHMVMWINFQFIRELLPLKDIVLGRALQFLTNSAVQFDALIFVSAFSFGFYNNGLWKSFKYIVKKYLRLTPTIMILSAVMTLFPYMYMGTPTWTEITERESINCQNSSLYNLIYIQNFMQPANACMRHTWLFCVELQLAVAFLPIMLVLQATSSQMAKTVILGAVAALGFALDYGITFSKDLPPTLVWTMPDPELRYRYFNEIFFMPWAHLSTFAIAVAFGQYCRNNRTHFQGGPYGRTVGSMLAWAAAGGGMAAVLFSFNDWMSGYLPGPVLSAIYNAGHRVVWSVAMGWIVYTCVSTIENNKKSKLSEFLGSSLFVTLGRLSFTAYLTGPLVTMLALGSQEQNLFSSLLIMLYYVIGNIFLTYVISFVVTLVFELPFSNLLNARESQAYKGITLIAPINPHKPNFDFGPHNGDMEMAKANNKEVIRL